MKSARDDLSDALTGAVPVAFLVASLACDLVALWMPQWTALVQASFYALAVGFVASLGLLVPRIVDRAAVREASLRGVARTHAWTTGGAVAVFGLDLWLRQNGLPATGTPLWLSIGGVTLLALSTTTHSKLVAAGARPDA